MTPLYSFFNLSNLHKDIVKIIYKSPKYNGVYIVNTQDIKNQTNKNPSHISNCICKLQEKNILKVSKSSTSGVREIKLSALVEDYCIENIKKGKK